MTTKKKLVLPSIVALVVVLGAAAGIMYSFPSNPPNTQEFPLRQSASDSSWNFTASINATLVAPGQTITLMTELTNVSPSNQTIAPYVNPIVNPGVYASNGTQLWGWNPLQATWPSMTFASGQSISGSIAIPTSHLVAGQTYTIKVVPLATQFLTPGNFALAFQFSVSACSGYPPGGNCPGYYSYTFAVSVNYTGDWRATYYGFHSVGAPPSPFSGRGNFTGGVFSGAGFATKTITLTGPNNEGLTICVQASKLDSSASAMVLQIGPRSNSTAAAFGTAQVCMGVVP